MGWWKCNKNGGIDWNSKPSGHGGNALINAIPDRDTTEDYYNGDAPSDAMYVPIGMLKLWLKDKPKPTTDQLTELFTNKVFDNVFDHIDRNQLNELIDTIWKAIDDIYRKSWGRVVYPEEKVFICKFSFGGADRVQGDWTDWWELRESDEKYIKNFKEKSWSYWWFAS